MFRCFLFGSCCKLLLVNAKSETASWHGCSRRVSADYHQPCAVLQHVLFVCAKRGTVQLMFVTAAAQIARAMLRRMEDDCV